MILRNFFFLPFGENAVLFSPSLFTYSRPRTGYNGLLLSTRKSRRGTLSPFFYAPYYEQRRSTPIEQIFEQELYLPHSSGRTRGKRGEGGIRDRSMWPGKRGMFVFR